MNLYDISNFPLSLTMYVKGTLSITSTSLRQAYILWPWYRRDPWLSAAVPTGAHPPTPGPAHWYAPIGTTLTFTLGGFTTYHEDYQCWKNRSPATLKFDWALSKVMNTPNCNSQSCRMGRGGVGRGGVGLGHYTYTCTKPVTTVSQSRGEHEKKTPIHCNPSHFQGHDNTDTWLSLNTSQKIHRIPDV